MVRLWLRENISESLAGSMCILYGGSVTAANCGNLAKMQDIDGFLVGGASLKEEFIKIVQARL